MLGPWGVAAAAAGTAAFALYENWDTVGPMIKDGVAKIGGYLMDFADTDWFAKGQQIGDMVANWFGQFDIASLAAWYTSFAIKIGAKVSSMNWSMIGMTVGAKIAEWFQNVDWGAVGAALLTGIITAGKIMLAGAALIAGLVGSLLVNTLSGAWNVIKAVGAAAWDGIKQAGVNAVNAIIVQINELISKWNALAPSFAAIPTIPAIANANAGVAAAAAARGGSAPGPLSGEVTVNLRDSGGRQVATARAPVSGSNKPARPGR